MCIYIPLYLFICIYVLCIHVYVTHLTESDCGGGGGGGGLGGKRYSRIGSSYSFYTRGYARCVLAVAGNVQQSQLILLSRLPPKLENNIISNTIK